MKKKKNAAAATAAAMITAKNFKECPYKAGNSNSELSRVQLNFTWYKIYIGEEKSCFLKFFGLKQFCRKQQKKKKKKKKKRKRKNSWLSSLFTSLW